MDQTEPLVTVFMPTYARNHSGYLQRAIESILLQTYKNWEFLIVDDGSIDGTKDVIKTYSEKDSRIRHIRYFNRNTGLPALITGMAAHEAKGKYFTWVFDDAILYPNHLETFVQYLEQSLKTSLVYAKAKAVLEDDKFLIVGKKLNIDALNCGENHIPNTAVMLRKDLIDEIGWYDPNIILKRCCDLDLWIRTAKRHRIDFIDLILAEEDGAKLQDSLGNAYTSFPALIHDYMSMDRNNSLKTQYMATYDCLKIPQHLNEKYLKDFSFLVSEHYFNTQDYKSMTLIGKVFFEQLPENQLNALIEKFDQESSELYLFVFLKTYLSQKMQQTRVELNSLKREYQIALAHAEGLAGIGTSLRILIKSLKIKWSKVVRSI